MDVTKQPSGNRNLTVPGALGFSRPFRRYASYPPVSFTILSPESPGSSSQALDLEQQRQQLIQDVTLVAEEARQTIWRRALFLWLSAVALIGLLLVGLDVLLKQDDLLLRWFLFVSFVVLSTLAAWKLLIPAKRFAPDVQAVAGWIERSKIADGEKLATAIRLSLIADEDSHCGGSEFRRLAMMNWFQLRQQTDWSGMVDRTSARRGLVALVAVAALMLIFAAVSPASAALGTMRLFMPFLDLPWPRADRLVFVDLPSAVAFGSELQLEIMDENDPLPATIDLYAREQSEDGGYSEARVYAANTFGEVAVATIPRVERPIEVRAVGGDDDSMSWRRIDVVRPPEITEHSFRIVAPEYARIPDGLSEESQVTALRGSQVALTGSFNETVAKLEVVPKPLKGTSRNETSPRPLSNISCKIDGLDFGMGSGSDVWFAESTLRWQFRVHTVDGLQVDLPRVWSLDVLQDRMPAIALESPRLSSVSRQAKLRVVGEVRDDLGLIDIKMLIGSAADVSDEARLANMDVLYEQVVALDLDRRNEPVREYSIQSSIDLGKIDLNEEQEFRLWVEARDSLGQVARSTPQPYRIRSTEKILEAIQKREEKIGERLGEIIRSQKKNSQASRRIETLMREMEVVDEGLADAMSDVNLIQKTIQDQVENETSGLLGDLQELSDLLQQNGLESSPLANDVHTMAEALARISETSLENALQTSQDALLSARRRLVDSNAAPLDGELLEKQSAASEAAHSALEDLQSLQGKRERSVNDQRIQNDLKRIIDEQQGIRGETQTLELKSVKQPLAPSVSAQSRVLGSDQASLARDLDGLVAELQALELSSDGNETEPEGIGTQIVRYQVSQRMRQAADFLTNDKMSSALIQQDQALAALREILSQASSGEQDPSDFANRASEMQRAAQQLAELSALQRALADAIATGDAAEVEGFLSQQASLQQQVDEQRDLLSSGASSQVIQSLEAALNDQKQTQLELAGQNLPSASDAARRAAESLVEATQALDRSAENMQLQAQEQRVYRLEEELAQLLQAQLPIVEEIAQLGAKMEEQSALLSSQTSELAAREEVVANRVERMLADSDLEELANLPGFGWVLEQAFAELQRTVAALQRSRVRPEAEDSSAAALRKMELLKESLEQNASQNDADPDGTQQEPEKGDESDESKSKIPPLASLKLLRGVQADINRRTIEVHRSGASEPVRGMRLRELTQQQQALAKQLEKLIEESSQK
ncbi:MAG: hypothetical protein ACE361_23905 [Aureliella sp.]